MNKRAEIHVTGIVQGVGFRPFIYNVAKSLSLTGFVFNLGDAGVKIIVEGKKSSIEDLIDIIKNSPPSISRIDSLNVDWKNTTNSFQSFEIRKSSETRLEGSVPVLPPDIAMCNDCIEDLLSSESRWYHYPFTSCAACGPRFSTITNLPYDRPNTTMVDFPLCDTCNTGYTNPTDRRYHAQTTACESCGPRYRLVDVKGNQIKIDNPVRYTGKLIEDNKVIAIQGIAGTHIATKTSDSKAIKILRYRKKRFQRPFAVMARDLSTLKQFANLTPEQEKILTSWRRPIVLLQKRIESRLIPEDVQDKIAPGLDTIGVMLPYAPIHYLLFQYSNEPALVMTSANPTGVPMYIEPEIIISELEDIVDYSLIHNRRIHQRADDSVVKFVKDDKPVFIRRARSYVPDPLQFWDPWKSIKAVAVGPEEKVTASVLRSGRIYPTQHIGDINRVESLDFLSNAIDHILHLLGVTELDGVACDYHPEFLTTEYAEQISNVHGIPLFRVQHHHAHLASMIVDHKLNPTTSIVCITTDGYGLSMDNTGWGGEILLGNLEDFKRVGGLRNVDYPGGDFSAVYAARSVIGILNKSLEKNSLLQIVNSAPIGPNTELNSESLDIILEAVNNRINTMNSTSAGRFLDAVAMILGICSENSYDGECPMKLEASAKKTNLQIRTEIKTSYNGLDLDIVDVLTQIVELKQKGINKQEIAYAAQWFLGNSLADIACIIAREEGVDHIGFSGGVALNHIITKAIIDRVNRENLISLIHVNVPPGDGGISIGQVAVAGAKLTK